MKIIQLILLVLFSLASLSSIAQAKLARELPYNKQVLYNAALRYVRVTKDMPISDESQEGGYIIFQYTEGSGKDRRASLEFVPKNTDERQQTMLILKISKAPAYVESQFYEGLAQKLKHEQQ